tara:strand:+ start:1744 stop:2034 length:291 start_codon:yes stop_codon:yes gene_type:complete
MEQNNKIIAEFMGVGKHYEAQSSNMFNQYHTDWNKLISVIHKCFDVANDGAMADIMHHLQVAEIGDTYDAVVEFIKEYNFLNEVEDNLHKPNNYKL